MYNTKIILRKKYYFLGDKSFFNNRKLVITSKKENVDLLVRLSSHNLLLAVQMNDLINSKRYRELMSRL